MTIQVTNYRYSSRLTEAMYSVFIVSSFQHLKYVYLRLANILLCKYVYRLCKYTEPTKTLTQDKRQTRTFVTEDFRQPTDLNIQLTD